MYYSTASGLRSQLVSGDRFYQNCHQVFCGWDYSLNKDKAAKYKHMNLYQELTVSHMANMLWKSYTQTWVCFVIESVTIHT